MNICSRGKRGKSDKENNEAYSLEMVCVVLYHVSQFTLGISSVPSHETKLRVRKTSNMRQKAETLKANIKK